MFHIVLVEPEIPQNTGNIARTCAVTGTRLHLVRPLGFSIDDRSLKRAGLDYWDALQVCCYDDFHAFTQAHPQARMFFLSTHAKRSYAEVSYRDGDFLVFGKETAGLPKDLLQKNAAHAVRIPMGDGLRSLNLSNSVAIVLYEALRQVGFTNLH